MRLDVGMNPFRLPCLETQHCHLLDATELFDLSLHANPLSSGWKPIGTAITHPVPTNTHKTRQFTYIHQECSCATTGWGCNLTNIWSVEGAMGPTHRNCLPQYLQLWHVLLDRKYSIGQRQRHPQRPSTWLGLAGLGISSLERIDHKLSMIALV